MLESTPVNPASAIDGTFGISAERFGCATASAVSLLSPINCSTFDAVANATEMRPVIRSVVACAVEG